MPPIHMTETEVLNDFSAVLEKINQGQDVVVDRNGSPVALIKSPVQEPPKTATEQLERALARDKARGYSAVMDEDFAEAVRQVVKERQPYNPKHWD